MALGEPPVPCRGGPYPSRVDAPRGETVRIGPLEFPGLAYPHGSSRFGPGAPALTVPVIVPARTEATIAVPPELRDVAGVDSDPSPATSPSTAHRSAVCSTVASTRTFDVSFVVRGARCVPVSVTVGRRTSTRSVAFGVPRCPP